MFRHDRSVTDDAILIRASGLWLQALPTLFYSPVLLFRISLFSLLSPPTPLSPFLLRLLRRLRLQRQEVWKRCQARSQPVFSGKPEGPFCLSCTFIFRKERKWMKKSARVSEKLVRPGSPGLQVATAPACWNHFFDCFVVQFQITWQWSWEFCSVF